MIFDHNIQQGYYSQEYLVERRRIKSELIWRQRAIILITAMFLVIAAIALTSIH